MFTGLVTHRGQLTATEKQADGGLTLTIANPFPTSEPVQDGESIAVNGCCLTALINDDKHSDKLSFFVSEETLSLTTIGNLNRESTVNLERALRLGDRFGGHIVSGHIDCIGRIEDVQSVSGSTCFTVAYPAKHSAMIITKGSVTIDGVSLTINELIDTPSNKMRSFTVNIIPHTSSQTGFSNLTPGDSVNLEFDMFAKFALRSEELRKSKKSETFSDSLGELTESMQKG